MKDKLKKIISVIAVILFTFSLLACKEERPIYEEEGLSYSEKIANVKTVGQLTGRGAFKNTFEQWRIGGTDLGIPFYNSAADEMLLLFGDTFENNANMTGGWRSNLLAKSSDFELSDGLTIDDFYKGPTGVAKAIIEGHHSEGAAGHEVSKIPTGGIELNGTLYVFYMSVKSWGTHGSWQVNYNGVIKSQDNGQTWERVYDLTWVNTLSSDNKQTVLRLVNEDVNLSPDGGSIVLEGREAPCFMQIYPVDGYDGYIYIFGIPQGRGGGLKLGRVLKTSFENFDEYEYIVENGTDGNFSKGRAALAENSSLIDGNILNNVSEPSVMYNDYLSKWMIVYLANDKIIFRIADSPYGEWSDAEIIITAAEYSGLYGGFVHEKYSRENGKFFYAVISAWMPVYNTFLIEVEVI